MTETQAVKPHKADHQSFALSAQEPGPKEACPPTLFCQLLKRPETETRIMLASFSAEYN